MALFTDRRELSVQAPVINRNFEMNWLGDIFYDETGRMNKFGKTLSFLPGGGEAVRAAGVLGAKGSDTKAVMREGRDEMWAQRFAGLKLARDVGITLATAGGASAAGTATGLQAKLGSSKLGQSAFNLAQKYQQSGISSFLPGQDKLGSAAMNMFGNQRFDRQSWDEQQRKDLDKMNRMDREQGLYKKGGKVKPKNNPPDNDPPNNNSSNAKSFELDNQAYQDSLYLHDQGLELTKWFKENIEPMLTGDEDSEFEAAQLWSDILASNSPEYQKVSDRLGWPEPVGEYNPPGRPEYGVYQFAKPKGTPAPKSLPTYQEAYASANKKLFPTYESFVYAAEMWNKEGRNPTKKEMQQFLSDQNGANNATTEPTVTSKKLTPAPASALVIPSNNSINMDYRGPSKPPIEMPPIYRKQNFSQPIEMPPIYKRHDFRQPILDKYHGVNSDTTMRRTIPKESFKTGGKIKYFNGGIAGDPPGKNKYSSAENLLNEDIEEQYGPLVDPRVQQANDSIMKRLAEAEEQITKMTGTDEESIKRSMYNQMVEQGNKMLGEDNKIGSAAMNLLNPDVDIIGSAVNLIGSKMATMDAYNDAAKERIYGRRTEQLGEFNMLG